MAKTTEQPIATIKRELKIILGQLWSSEEYQEGFSAGMDNVQEVIPRYETGTSQYDDFLNGHDAGLRTKQWLESE